MRNLEANLYTYIYIYIYVYISASAHAWGFWRIITPLGTENRGYLFIGTENRGYLFIVTYFFGGVDKCNLPPPLVQFQAFLGGVAGGWTLLTQPAKSSKGVEGCFILCL